MIRDYECVSKKSRLLISWNIDEPDESYLVYITEKVRISVDIDGRLIEQLHRKIREKKDED